MKHDEPPIESKSRSPRGRTLAGAGVAVIALLGSATAVDAATNDARPDRDVPVVEAMDQMMMNDMDMADGGPMGRHHGRMVSESPEMARMHARMVSGESDRHG